MRMYVPVASAALALAALALAAVSPAQARPLDPRVDGRQDLARFDASLTRDPVRTLVACDTTAFLSTRPNLNADRILAQRTGRPFERLLGPDFVQNGQIYGEAYERAFHRLRRRGVTRAQVAAVQADLGRPMIRQYGRRFLPNGFVRAQTRTCNGWLRSLGVSPGF